MNPDGETTAALRWPDDTQKIGVVNEFDAGFVVGLLVGEGHFGGDGRQPHVTLRMHTRHEHIFRWLQRQFPDSKLYGPYSHGGRDYYQWMARGTFLREELIPLLDEHLTDELDEWAFTRFRDMKARYRIGDDPGLTQNE